MEQPPAETRSIPFAEAERDAIREQLERMLANPLFRHSRRYPTLLRYVVEQTLAGGMAELKERTLGVAVFGREPDYDTNADPVVRMTAGEIRKRIAQYYHEYGHEGEIRIDLPPGSYVPEFQLPAAPPASAPPPEPAHRRSIALALVLTVSLAAILTIVWRASRPHTALDRFWRPVLASSETVLLCVGQREFLATSPETPNQYMVDLPRPPATPADFAAPVSLFKLYYLGSQNVALPDVMTLSRLAGLMYANGKPYQIRPQRSLNFSDLRGAPVVLVGALDNNWTMRLTGHLRFNYDRDGANFYIRDEQKPGRIAWKVDYSTPYLNLAEDYALISRVLDPNTERMVVVAGGLSGFGTVAAGEFVTNPSYLAELVKDAPSNWESKNLQAVIATRVIDGVSGPPRILEKHFW